MDKNPLLKYVMKADKEDVLHSSAYGKAQNGAGMGVTSSESFETRRRIDENRKVVGGYGSSRVATQVIGNGPRAKVYTPPSGEAAGLGMRGGVTTNRNFAVGASVGSASAAPARPPMPRRNPGISR